MVTKRSYGLPRTRRSSAHAREWGGTFVPPLSGASFITVILVLFFFSGSVQAASAENIPKSIAPMVSLLLGHSQVDRGTLNDNVIPVLSTDSGQIIAVADGSTDETVIQAQGALADAAAPGEIVFVPAGADARFPLGFAGRVASVTTNGDGTKDLALDPVSYADIFAESDVDLNNIVLDADNFVGVIAPSAIQAAGPATAKSLAGGIAPGDYSFRNGAIVVHRTRGMSFYKHMPKTTVNAGTVSLNMKVNLEDMPEVDASRMQPIDASTDLGFVITGELSNIRITKEIDFSLLKGLDSMNLRLDGDLDFDVKFNGRGTVELGYFSRAWNEVKDQAIRLFGVKGKLFGLKVDNKIGRYPLAGLVWSVTCPHTCPVLTGKTQTPVRQAKVLGVILWLYLDLDGTLEIDGDLHLVRLRPGTLSLGVKKDPGGRLEMARSLTPKESTGRFLEAPALNGTLGLKLFFGLTVDLDFLTTGIYVANAGLDVGGEGDTLLTGTLSYGTSALDQPWSWQGSACFDANYGTGAIARAAARFGVELPTAWRKKSLDFEYSGQWPTDDEKDIPGRHYLWYTGPGVRMCVNMGSVGARPLNDTGITWGGDYPAGNNSTCTGVDTGDNSALGLQDCAYGRDATQNDDSDGHAGFSFTKISATGQELPASATEWSCVKDNVTGLIWEVKTTDGGLHDWNDTYTWYNTDPATNGGAEGYDGAFIDTCYGYNSDDPTTFCNTQAYVARVNDEGLCGYTDWRMPSRNELLGIVDLGETYSYPIYTDYFPNPRVTWFAWSGSAYANGSDKAWSVQYFNLGISLRSHDFQVRLVRGSQ